MTPAEEDRTPTVDRMRIDTDRGRTGDKVAVEDPAAAPLGTDAEAGGAGPTLAERKLETNARTAASRAATGRRTPRGASGHSLGRRGGDRQSCSSSR